MTDLLAAFFVTEGFLIIVQTLIAYLLVLFIFQMEIKGSVLGFLLITILTGAAGLSLGKGKTQIFVFFVNSMATYLCSNTLLCRLSNSATCGRRN